MKLFLLGFIIFYSVNICKAQLKGSIAPDVTLTDLNGNSHNLYSYLDSGVTVVFDIFATWCMPCRSFRDSHVFDSLELHYGMNGTILPRKIKVFSIEFDPMTNHNALLNWAKNSNYSYIEYDNFHAIYPAPAIPQFYIICPNRVISYDSAGIFPELYKESFWLSYADNCPKIITAIPPSKSVNNIKVFPNPASDHLNVNFELQYIQPIEIQLTDIYGKPVSRKEINSSTTLVNENIFTGNLASGIYILQILTKTERQNIRILITN